MNKKVLLTLCFVSCILFITGCSKSKKDTTFDGLCNCTSLDNCKCKNIYQKITSNQAKNLIYNSNTFLIDVRSSSEYVSGHIDGAMSIPLDEIENINFAKTINLIIYCKSGSRSKKAAQKLLDMGYVNVYDLGSMDNWQ